MNDPTKLESISIGMIGSENKESSYAGLIKIMLEIEVVMISHDTRRERIAEIFKGATVSYFSDLNDDLIEISMVYEQGRGESRNHINHGGK